MSRKALDATSFAAAGYTPPSSVCVDSSDVVLPPLAVQALSPSSAGRSHRSAAGINGASGEWAGSVARSSGTMKKNVLRGSDQSVGHAAV